jgi:hypothetical protein
MDDSPTVTVAVGVDNHQRMSASFGGFNEAPCQIQFAAGCPPVLHCQGDEEKLIGASEFDWDVHENTYVLRHRGVVGGQKGL